MEYNKKWKNRKFGNVLMDIVGYASGITISAIMFDILRRIYKYGSTCVHHSTGKPLLLCELGIAGGTVVFLGYKFIKDIVRREKGEEREKALKKGFQKEFEHKKRFNDALKRITTHDKNL
jgi:hypothetical protein